MPQIHFTGISDEHFNDLKEEIVDELSILLDRDKKFFFLSLNKDLLYYAADKHPMVKFTAFKRSLEVKKSIAKIINEKLQKKGYKNVSVTFMDLEKENYFSF